MGIFGFSSSSTFDEPIIPASRVQAFGNPDPSKYEII
jgi:hypothetical protein